MSLSAKSKNELSEDTLWDSLRHVFDPETDINIVDMGLVYSVKIHEKTSEKPIIWIQHTLTTPACPLAGTIQNMIREQFAKDFSSIDWQPENIQLELVFDPPWSLEKMSAEARASLGF
jgi:metal-sulfur cluster biosynthetic enzyme